MDRCEEASWEMHADAVGLGTATKTEGRWRTGSLGDTGGTKKIKTNAVALEGATSIGVRVQ
jgi:hypothetical protein